MRGAGEITRSGWTPAGWTCVAQPCSPFQLLPRRSLGAPSPGVAHLLRAGPWISCQTWSLLCCRRPCRVVKALRPGKESHLNPQHVLGAVKLFSYVGNSSQEALTVTLLSFESEAGTGTALEAVSRCLLHPRFLVLQRDGWAVAGRRHPRMCVPSDARNPCPPPLSPCP